MNVAYLGLTPEVQNMSGSFVDIASTLDLVALDNSPDGLRLLVS